MKQTIARKKIKFYNVDAVSIAQRHGLRDRINVIMETAMLKLLGIIPFDTAMAALKQQVQQMYGHEGENVVQANIAAMADAPTA